MLRFIILAVIGGLIYWFWKWTMDRYNRLKNNLGANPTTKQAKGSSELIQDPICKTYIAKESAISYKGQYFCSSKCKEDYITNNK